MENFIDFSNDDSYICNIDYENENINPYLYNNEDTLNYINTNKLLYYPFDNLNTILNYKKIINKYSIDICIYKIINNSLKPFLLFYLIESNGILSWPDLSHFDISNNVSNKNFINTILSSINSLFNNSINNLTYNGIFYDKCENKYMLWFYYNVCNYNNNNNNINCINTNDDNNYWISLYEIINTQKYINIEINYKITNFFLNYNEFCYLKYNDIYLNKILNIDIPIICYFNNKNSINNIIENYGLIKQNINSSFGPFYYFGNYNKSQKYSLFRKNNNSTIRFALFLCNYTHLINNELYNPDLFNKFDTIIYKYNTHIDDTPLIKYIVKNETQLIFLSIH